MPYRVLTTHHDQAYLLPNTLQAQFTAFPWRSVARGVACFLGGFSLLNLLGDMWHAGFDANLWWIDLRPLPGGAAHILLFLAAGGLLWFGVTSGADARRDNLVRGIVILLLLITIGNAVTYEILLITGVVFHGCWVPVSAITATALGLLLRGISRQETTSSRNTACIIAVTVLCCLLLFPLAQILCFGATDYRRPAEAIIVFGARAYADGGLSSALQDRVDTACRLYAEGYAPLLIFSGGPAEGTMHETEAMRRWALTRGIPPQAILTDRYGLDTRDTVRNTVALFRRRHLQRVLAVSHFYHLPRIKLTYQRAGWDVYTVPAESPQTPQGLPYLTAREIVALWVYYLECVPTSTH